MTLHDLYKKAVSFVAGEAMAHSDRVQIAVKGVVGIAFLQISAACGVCGQLLTPAIADKLSLTLGAAILTGVASLTSRDIAAPGEFVPGAAIAVSVKPAVAGLMKAALDNAGPTPEDPNAVAK